MIDIKDQLSFCNHCFFEGVTRKGVRRLTSLILLFPLLFTISCQKDGIAAANSGTVEVTPNPIAFNQVPPGGVGTVAVSLKNAAATPLTIYELAIKGESGGGTDGLFIDGVPSGEFTIPPRKEKQFSILYKPTLTSPIPKAVLAVRSSDPRFTNESPYKVEIFTVDTAAEINVSPESLRFAKTSGRPSIRHLTIRNSGTRDLVLTKMPEVTSGVTTYKVGKSSLGHFDEAKGKYPVTIKPYDPKLAKTNPNDYTLELEVAYAPDVESASGEVEDGKLTIFYKEAGRSEEKKVQVPLSTSVSGPSIFIYPLTRDFGQVPVGSVGSNAFTITNYGNEDLEIKDLILSKNSADDEFSLDKVTLPITLKPDQSSAPIQLHYQPKQKGIDSGVLIVKSNDSFQPALSLDLQGRGAVGLCPVVSVGGYVEGSSAKPLPSITAKPLDYIVLDGSASKDDDGDIRKWNWSVVKKPQGASTTFEPLPSDTTNSDFSKRRYRPLVAGEYEIALNVVDNEGFSACATKTVKISVKPAKKIHIELTWTNPADPDETDNVGSDVDLHMVKMGSSLPDGPGRWFEKPYDIYFKNKKNVEWNPETPTLDIDDRDGAGPENIQLGNPVKCGWYAVGVDYFKQIYGTAYVTIKVYVNQSLVYEAPNYPLEKQNQFWDILRIHWNGTDATVLDVSKLYDNRPSKEPPVVTTEMSNPPYCAAYTL